MNLTSRPSASLDEANVVGSYIPSVGRRQQEIGHYT